jgi:3-hydroxyacyl-[acyl-carrier-protein] dehydratase
MSELMVLEAENEGFRGHFPEYPIFPGVLLIEGIARIAENHAARQRFPIDSGSLQVKKTRFHQPSLPGDVLEIDSHFSVDEQADAYSFKAQIKNEGQRVADIHLVYRAKVS